MNNGSNIVSKLLFVSGIAVFIFGITVISEALKCLAWQETQGEIIGSYVRDLPVPETKTHNNLTPDIVYEYETPNGKSYFSNRISYIESHLFPHVSENYYAGDYEKVKGFISEYPVGQKVKVFFNPNRPHEAVLDRRLKLPIFIPMLFGLIMIYASFHFYIFRRLASTKKNTKLSPVNIAS